MALPPAVRASLPFLADIADKQPVYQRDCLLGHGATIEDWSKPDSSGLLRAEFAKAQKAPPAERLRALGRGWMTATPHLQQKAICQYMFWDAMLEALTPLVDSGWALPQIQHYLERVTDTTLVPMSLVRSGLVQQSPSAAHVAGVAEQMGEPNRYDAIIANAGVDNHTQTYGYRNIKARTLALLGRAYLVDGKIEDATRALASARALVPTSDPLLGARIALSMHDTVSAVQEMALCRLVLSCLNSDDAGTQRMLERLYRAVNHHALTGLDTLLLAAYRRPAFDLPVRITPWELRGQSATHSRRTPVVQFMTWVHCTPCASHDYASRGLVQRFGDDVIVLAYTYYPPLTPPGFRIKDGRSTSTSYESDLSSWYEHMKATTMNYDSKGPTHCNGMILDGACVQSPSEIDVDGGKDAASLRYDETAAAIEQRMTIPPPVQLALTARLDGDRVVTSTEVRASPGAPPVAPNRRLKVHVVLVEDSVLVTGANSPVQQHLVRSIAGDSASDYGYMLPKPVSLDAAQTVAPVFDLPQLEHALRQRGMEDKDMQEPEWFTKRAFHVERSHLSVVAYVQDQDGGEILQAVRAYLPSSGSAATSATR